MMIANISRRIRRTLRRLRLIAPVRRLWRRWSPSRYLALEDACARAAQLFEATPLGIEAASHCHGQQIDWRHWWAWHLVHNNVAIWQIPVAAFWPYIQIKINKWDADQNWREENDKLVFIRFDYHGTIERRWSSLCVRRKDFRQYLATMKRLNQAGYYGYQRKG